MNMCIGFALVAQKLPVRSIAIWLPFLNKKSGLPARRTLNPASFPGETAPVDTTNDRVFCCELVKILKRFQIDVNEHYFCVS